MLIQPLERRGVALVRIHEVLRQSLVFAGRAGLRLWRGRGSSRGDGFQECRPIFETCVPRDQFASFREFEARRAALLRGLAQTIHTASDERANVLERDNTVKVAA